MNHCAGPRNCYESPMKDRYADFPVGMAYVPWQNFTEVYEPDKAFSIGTIFPELNLPYTGREVGKR